MKALAVITFVAFTVAIILLLAWIISFSLGPILLTFGLPTVTPKAILGLMVAVGLFKGFLNLFEKNSK